MACGAMLQCRKSIIGDVRKRHDFIKILKIHDCF